MVGEQAQEMQLAHWLPTTTLPWLQWIPGWMGTWFSVFPTLETLVAQLLAAILVIGSYFLARHQTVQAPHRRGGSPAHNSESELQPVQAIKAYEAINP
jgi:high-affinity iron transporter